MERKTWLNRSPYSSRSVFKPCSTACVLLPDIVNKTDCDSFRPTTVSISQCPNSSRWLTTAADVPYGVVYVWSLAWDRYFELLTIHAQWNSPFLRQDRKSYQVPDALSVSALPQKTRISWLSAALWGNDYFVFDVRRHAVPNLQSSACMASDSVLTLAIPTSRAMRLFGGFHCSSTSICARFSRVRWRYFYLWYTRSGPWQTSRCGGVW